MDKSGWNMYVFRGGRRVARGRDLKTALANTIKQLSEKNDGPDRLISALIAAGELECALADSDSAFSSAAARVTDAVAAELVRQDSSGVQRVVHSADLLKVLESIEPPETVQIAVHEGFAYYALHPLKFAHVLDSMDLPATVAVVGIRSIGVTLSAVTTAALRLRGLQASRISVRPAGHPYDRSLELTDDQQSWTRSFTSESAFLVVDEGPGLSGSSFLASAEALECSGVATNRIVLLGTRTPDPHGLRAPNGAQRWKRFRSLSTAPDPYLPTGADVVLAGGIWREKFLSPGDPCPPSWTQLELLKYLSYDRSTFLRFEGYGHYGEELADRAHKLAEAGYSPKVIRRDAGFTCYEFLDGRTMSPGDADSAVLRRIAEYCAFRGATFATEIQTPDELEQMVRFNWQNEFGSELEPEFHLSFAKPTITDSRMTPLKWLLTPGGAFKVDAVSHGDGHFFPGPCDIAWDLAGAILDWHLDPEQTALFLQEYERASSDDARPRICAYQLAYSVFRLAYARMAARAMGGTPEEPLFTAEYKSYRQRALEIHSRLVPELVTAAPTHGLPVSDPPQESESTVAA